MAKDLTSDDITKHVRFRRAAKKDADKFGDKFFMFMGAIDTRTCPECEKHIGVVYTEEELLKINPKVFTHGLCSKCRCSLSPQARRDSAAAKRYGDVVREQRALLDGLRGSREEQSR